MPAGPRLAMTINLTCHNEGAGAYHWTKNRGILQDTSWYEQIWLVPKKANSIYDLNLTLRPLSPIHALGHPTAIISHAQRYLLVYMPAVLLVVPFRTSYYLLVDLLPPF
jgi:hypothetical protein